MKISATLFLAAILCACGSKTESPDDKGAAADIKSIVLQQLKSSHNEANWYAPMNSAVQGLTAEQANWKDSTANHSIGQLVSHLIFWNERNLIAFNGGKAPDFSGNNEETFTRFDPANWAKAVAHLDSVETKLEEVFSLATDEQLQKWAPVAANIASHNAYHTGQIIYIRKHKGWWNPEQGVK
jgi:hypothetical protein